MVEDVPVDPVAYLRRFPPFDRLSPASTARIGATLEVRYAPVGERIVAQGGPPSSALFVIRKGTVRLEKAGHIHDILEAGECFGYPSMIAASFPQFDAIAAEDCLLYAIPETTFRVLLDEASVARFFLDGLADRLRSNVRPGSDRTSEFLGLRLREIAKRAPVTVSARASVGEAARRMRDERVSSILISGDVLGILTERDLKSRVLAEGLGPDTPVEDVMTSPLVTASPEATVLEALLLLTDRDIRHLPLRDKRGIVGVVSATDLVRLQARDPLSLLRRLDRDKDNSVVGSYRDEVVHTVDRLSASGVEAVSIARIVASMNDALVRKILARVEESMGSAPAAWTWVVYGSDGRREQILPTDQDNALIWGNADEGAATYFAEFARRGVAELLAAGFPECRGGYMATNWQGPLDLWRERFRGWLRTPHPKSILDACNLFDMRSVAGPLDIRELLEEKQAAATDAPFLKALAEKCVELDLPLGFFHTLREGTEGLDLKLGILLIVSLARLVSLEAKGSAVSTVERLHEGRSVLGDEDAATLTEAFTFLLGLRLEHQIRRIREGQPPGNRVPLNALNAMERRFLKEIFAFLRQAQSALPQRFGF